MRRPQVEAFHSHVVRILPTCMSALASSAEMSAAAQSSCSLVVSGCDDDSDDGCPVQVDVVPEPTAKRPRTRTQHRVSGSEGVPRIVVVIGSNGGYWSRPIRAGQLDDILPEASSQTRQEDAPSFEVVGFVVLQWMLLDVSAPNWPLHISLLHKALLGSSRAGNPQKGCLAYRVLDYAILDEVVPFDVLPSAPAIECRFRSLQHAFVQSSQKRSTWLEMQRDWFSMYSRIRLDGAWEVHHAVASAMCRGDWPLGVVLISKHTRKVLPAEPSRKTLRAYLQDVSIDEAEGEELAPEHGAVEPALLGSLRPSRRHRCRDRGPVGVVYNVDFIIDCLDFMPEVKSARHVPTANQKATKCTLGQHAQEWLQALERSGFKWPGRSKLHRAFLVLTWLACCCIELYFHTHHSDGAICTVQTLVRNTGRTFYVLLKVSSMTRRPLHSLSVDIRCH